MNLNRNSNLSKIYRWFYNEWRMPSNLCPYFWKLVLMFVLILPSAILSLPHTAYQKFDRDSHNPIFGLFGWGVLWIVFCVLVAISSLFIHYDKHSFMLCSSVTGWMTMMLLSLTGLVLSIIHLREKYIEKRAQNHCEEEPSNIISEFIKAKRNKYCPQITWKDEPK